MKLFKVGFPWFLDRPLGNKVPNKSNKRHYCPNNVQKYGLKGTLYVSDGANSNGTHKIESMCERRSGTDDL
jgi:hypothetical protein